LTKTGFRHIFPAVLTLALYGAFSVAATHDYLSWNRARWKALTDLMLEQHVTPEHIDGGFEFNAWYLYSRSYTNELFSLADKLAQNRAGLDVKVGTQPARNKSWWWVYGDDFVVTLGPVPGFTELKRYHFPRWLPPGEGSILVLRRTPVPDPSFFSNKMINPPVK